MTAPAPTVSVLLTVHDAGEYLRPTVESALAQTMVDLEIVLVDDGSTDGRVDEIAALAEPRIRILRQECRGAAEAFNTAAAAARGRFLALLDHDDLWLPRKLERHLRDFEERPGTDLNFSWCRFVDARGDDLGLPVRRWHGPISRDELLIDFVIKTTSAMVVRRDVVERIGGFDPALPRLSDLEFALRVAALRPGNCRAVPEVLTLYRRHTGQMSGQWIELQREWDRLLARIATQPDGPPAAARSLADSNMHRYFAWLASEQGELRSAVALLAAGMRRAPRRALADPRNWLLAAEIAARRTLAPRAFAGVRRVAGRVAHRLVQ
jgi:glycosyltransferase involved in cell wall biosynthesis